MAGCGRGIRESGVRRAVLPIAAAAVGLAPALARAFDYRIEGLRVLATLELTARLGP